MRSLPIAVAVVVALLLSLISCGGDGEATDTRSRGGAQSREHTGNGGSGHQRYAGPVPSMDRFLKLVPPDAESLIRVYVDEYQRAFCPEIWRDDGDYAECGLEEVIGLPPLSGAFGEIAQVPEIRESLTNFTVTGGSAIIVFQESSDSLHPLWEEILSDQGYERTEVEDAVLWSGPAPWEAFAFMGHDVVITAAHSDMTELLDRRHSDGPSLYDSANDVWKSLPPPAALRSLEQLPDGSIEGTALHHSPTGIRIVRAVTYGSKEQAQLGFQEWMAFWGTEPLGICTRPEMALEGRGFTFEAECELGPVLDDLRGS